GTGRAGHSGDGGPALQADIRPNALAIAADGTVYFANLWPADSWIRKVTPGGIVLPVAGGPWSTLPLEGIPATTVDVSPNGIALAPDGSLVFAEASTPRNDYPGGCVRRIGIDGVIRIVAGCSKQPKGQGDGGPARDALLSSPMDIAVDRDGTIYI